LNPAILNPVIQAFIKEYQGDITALAFAGSPFPEVSVQELIQQIEGRQKAKKKLDYLLNKEDIYFPPKLNLEQTSSEQTASYKASLILPGALADLTGGFGIDSYYFAKKATTVDYFEIDETLANIAQHNFKILDADNISVIHNSGLSIIENDTKYKTIYIDPSRRTKEKQKVFFLKDCLPNVPEHLDSLLEKCDLLMIKTSPMLDIHIGLEELKGVYEIHVVAVNNEVKELLWLCNIQKQDKVIIKTINLKETSDEHFSFKLADTAPASYSLPKKYIYEPNAAILKAGGFKYVTHNFAVQKLHQHTHLFTSEDVIDFPGRRFKIERVIPYNKKEMKTHIAGLKANVTTRNFPESVATIRKKWKLKDGGIVYLFFTTLLENNKVVLICSKI